MWNKYKSIALSYVVIKILAILIVALEFFIPYIVNLYCETISSTSDVQIIRIMLLCALYASTVPAMISCICLDKLLVNIKKDIVFDEKNVKYLRIVSWCCLVAAFIYFILGFKLLLAFGIFAAGAFFGLIIRVIKNVFSEAVKIKSENDLTI